MRIFSLSFLAFFLLFQAAWSAPLYLVSDENFPPYSYYEHGKAQGVDLDIVNEAARRAGVDIIIELFPWKRALQMIETGQADGAFSLFRNKEREKFVHFSKNPVHVSKLAAFMSTDSMAIYKTINDLFGKTVFISAGFSISKDFDQAVLDKNIKPTYVQSAKDGIERLLASDAGCFISNHVSVLYFANRLGVSKKIESIQTIINNKREAYLAISKIELNYPDRKNKLDRLDVELGKMHKDGTINKLTSAYIDISNL